MFWSDPRLYGADLPYREFRTPLHQPFMGPISPWHNVPRFLPPEYYGIAPQLFNVPTAFNVPPASNIPTTFDVAPMFNVPPMAFAPHFRTPVFNPFVQPQPMTNLPLYNLYRPYC